MTNSNKYVATILDVLRLTERLKCELRHSWLSTERQESVAEHCFQMAFFSMLVAPYLEKKVDLFKVLKMVLAHDVVEAEVGDIPYFEVSERKNSKQEREQLAMNNLVSIFPDPLGGELRDLWEEFEKAASIEAKLAKALDCLEAQFQHNLASLSTWETVEYDLVYTKLDEHCKHDKFLMAVCKAIKEEAEKKLIEGGIDVQAIRQRLVWEDPDVVG